MLSFSLLPLGDIDSLLAYLVRNDSSIPNPILYSLLEIADPSKSLAEIAAILELTLDECWNTVLHLQNWGIAYIIPIMTEESVLYIHPDAPLNSRSQVSLDFSAAYLGTIDPPSIDIPAYSLPCLLPIYNGTRSLSQALALMPQPLRAHGVDITVWLLRRRMLVMKDLTDTHEEWSAARQLRQKYPLI